MKYYNQLFFLWLIFLLAKNSFCFELKLHPQILPTEICNNIILNLDIATARSVFHTCQQFYQIYKDQKDPIRACLCENSDKIAEIPVNTYIAGLTHYAQDAQIIAYFIGNESEEQKKERLEICNFFGHKPASDDINEHVECTLRACRGKIKNKSREKILKALKENQEQVLKILIKNKVMLDELFYNKPRGNYLSYFSWAAGQKNYAELLKLLKKVGADPNAQGRKGNTLLHKVVCAHDTNPVRVLMIIDCGADVNIENELGYRPFDYAKSDEIKNLLIDNGAEVSWWQKLSCSFYI